MKLTRIFAKISFASSGPLTLLSSSSFSVSTQQLKQVCVHPYSRQTFSKQLFILYRHFHPLRSLPRRQFCHSAHSWILPITFESRVMLTTKQDRDSNRFQSRFLCSNDDPHQTRTRRRATLQTEGLSPLSPAPNVHRKNVAF